MRNTSDMIMGVGPKELFEYVKNKYSRIGQRQSMANQLKLNDPWDRHGPIETYWQMFEDVQEYAKFGGLPIDNQRCINTVLENLDKIPDFAQVCYNQRITPLREWSWEETKRNFKNAHKAHAEKTTGDHCKCSSHNRPKAGCNRIAKQRVKTGPQPITLNKNQWVLS
jgi:hypothetical protein